MTKLKEGWGVLAAKKSAESLGGHKQKVFVPNADHTLSQTVKIKVKKLSQNQFPHQIQIVCLH